MWIHIESSVNFVILYDEGPMRTKHLAVSNKNSVYEILIDCRTIFVVLTDTLLNHMFMVHNRIHTVKMYLYSWDAIFQFHCL
jgi:hypothetical protein